MSWRKCSGKRGLKAGATSEISFMGKGSWIG